MMPCMSSVYDETRGVEPPPRRHCVQDPEVAVIVAGLVNILICACCFYTCKCSFGINKWYWWHPHYEECFFACLHIFLLACAAFAIYLMSGGEEQHCNLSGKLPLWPSIQSVYRPLRITGSFHLVSLHSCLHCGGGFTGDIGWREITYNCGIFWTGHIVIFTFKVLV